MNITMSDNNPIYMVIKKIPQKVTEEEIRTFVNSILQCTVVCLGFDPKYNNKGKKFYFLKPQTKSVPEIIDAMKLKFVGGQRITINQCKYYQHIKLMFGKELFRLQSLNMGCVWINKNNQQDIKQYAAQPPFAQQSNKKPMTITKICKALFCELFDRYPQLDDINTNTNNLFGYEVVRVLTSRLNDTVGDNSVGLKEDIEKYRAMYPHETDYALVEAAYKKCADAPLPSEDELAVENMTLDDSLTLKLSDTKLENASTYYRNHLVVQLNKQITLLDERVSETATEEERARALVRHHLKAVKSDMGGIVQTWMTKFLKFHQHVIVRVYGIPRLPDINSLTMLVKSRGGPAKQMNYTGHLAFYMHRDRVDQVLAMSGNTLDGCTLLVRVQHRARVVRLARHFRAVTDMLRAAETEQWEDL